MNTNEIPEKYKTCDWLWNYGSIGLTKEHIKRLNTAINILESINEHTDAKYLKEIKDKLLEDTPNTKREFEEPGRQKPTKNIVETWRDMRLEVYQQASGNRHEPNYSDDSTKMFSLTDIDEIFEKIAEKQGEKTNPYSGVSFKYNGHIWGMCARDNGVDILLDKQLFKHLEKQGEQKPAEWSEEDKKMQIKILEALSAYADHVQYTGFCVNAEFIRSELIGWIKYLQPHQKQEWSEDDESMLQKTLSIIRYGLLIPIDKEDDPCFVGSSTISWLKSLKQRMEGK